jgi:hypothetical protein
MAVAAIPYGTLYGDRLHKMEGYVGGGQVYKTASRRMAEMAIGEAGPLRGMKAYQGGEVYE